MKKNPKEKQNCLVSVRLTAEQKKTVEQAVKLAKKKDPSYSEGQFFIEGRAVELGITTSSA